MTEGSGSQAGGRADEIRRAAIPVFAAQGFRRTSMADLAGAAGLSRAALYRYFRNRSDVFRAAFDAILNDATDAALAALHADGTTAQRLEGFLQRAYGDGYEGTASTPFGNELMEGRQEFAADVAVAAAERAHEGLRIFLLAAAGTEPIRAGRIIELLTLSPAGLKGDHPTPEAYRERLTALALAAAALLQESTSP
ncbi:MAG: helix-turn-helix domain-containing protein [Actinomycetota bacterium]